MSPSLSSQNIKAIFYSSNEYPTSFELRQFSKHVWSHKTNATAQRNLEFTRCYPHARGFTSHLKNTYKDTSCHNKLLILLTKQNFLVNKCRLGNKCRRHDDTTVNRSTLPRLPAKHTSLLSVYVQSSVVLIFKFCLHNIIMLTWVLV